MGSSHRASDAPPARREQSSTTLVPVRRGPLMTEPVSPAEQRAARREAERRALLRRTGAARLALDETESAATHADQEDASPADRVEVVLEEPAQSTWRAQAVRQAYLSTIPPAPCERSFRRKV